MSTKKRKFHFKFNERQAHKTDQGQGLFEKENKEMPLRCHGLLMCCEMHMPKILKGYATWQES